MIRALTVLIFIITPVTTAVGWILAGPLVAIGLLLALPLIGLGVVVQRLRRSPDATAALLSRRDEISGNTEN